MVKIYGRDNCSWCKKAVKLAEDYGLNYQYYDIYVEGVRDDFIAKGFKTVPQIWWGEEHVGDFNQFAQMVENTIGGYGEGQF